MLHHHELRVASGVESKGIARYQEAREILRALKQLLCQNTLSTERFRTEWLAVCVMMDKAR